MNFLHEFRFFANFSISSVDFVHQCAQVRSVWFDHLWPLHLLRSVSSTNNYGKFLFVQNVGLKIEAAGKQTISDDQLHICKKDKDRRKGKGRRFLF